MLKIRIITLLSFLLLLISGAQAYYVPVKIKGKFDVVPYDSIYYTNPPSAITTYSYNEYYGKNKVTRTIQVCTDSVGDPIVVITRSELPHLNLIEVDTILMYPDWIMMAHHNDKLDLKGVRKESKSSESSPTFHRNKLKKSDRKPWMPLYSMASPISLHDLAVMKFDSKGNWTEAHNYAGGSQMEQTACLKRTIKYNLSPEEKSLVEIAEAKRTAILDEQSRTPVPNRKVYIRFAVWILGFLLAMSALPGPTPNKLRPWIMLSGIFISLVGCALATSSLELLYGPIPNVILILLYLGAMCWYFNRITGLLADTRSLSNLEIKIPVTCLKILLPLSGLLIGENVADGPSLPFSVLGAICFFIPILFMRKEGVLETKGDGERCRNCHVVGRVYTEKIIECGKRTEKKNCYIPGYEETLNIVYQRVQELRRCRHCGYGYYTAPHDGEILSTYKTYENAPSSSNNKASGSQPMDYYKYRPTYDECRFYAGGACTRGGKYPCEYCSSNQANCRNFSPSNKFLVRIKR